MFRILLTVALFLMTQAYAIEAEEAHKSDPCHRCKCRTGPTGPTGPTGSAGSQIGAFFNAYSNTRVVSDDTLDPPFFVVPLSNVYFSSAEDFLIDALPVSRITLVKPGTYFITFGGSLAGSIEAPSNVCTLTLANAAGEISGGSIDLTASGATNGNLVSTSVILKTTQPFQILQLETFSFSDPVFSPSAFALAPTGDNSNSAFISIIRL